MSGELGGRKLTSPEGEDTRPTSERVREAIFNSLFSLDAIDDARVLDAFAGSGALGIEALSRGAVHTTFVETGHRALAALRDNLDTLGLVGRSTVVPADAHGVLARGEAFDLVLLDPPYGYDEWPALLGAMPAGALIVIESDREIEVPEEWVVHRVKHYGGTVVTLATARPQREAAS